MTIGVGVTLAVLATLVAVSWTLLARRLRRTGDLVPFEPREAVRWTGREALLVVAAYLFCSSIGAGGADAWYRRETQQSPPAAATASDVGDRAIPVLRLLRMLQGKVAGDLLFLAAVAIVFRLVRPTPRGELGLPFRPKVDLRVGLAGFLAIVPVVLLIQVGFVQILGKSVHPVLLGLAGSRDVELWVWSALAVVVAAPFVEEFLMRGIIQNWLARAWSFLAEPQRTPSGQLVPVAPLAVAFAHDGPIVATAGLFALLHLGHGPDPIALFFLALGIGYLFRQTNRIWAGWLIHLLLNTFSLIAIPLDN